MVEKLICHGKLWLILDLLCDKHTSIHHQVHRRKLLTTSLAGRLSLALPRMRRLNFVVSSRQAL
jgi:hypothetical protein